MGKLTRGLERAIEAAAVLLVVAFTLLILADVVCRYWLHIAIPWVSEMSVFMFQWTVSLGAILALKNGLHFGLGAVLTRAWPKLAVPLAVLVTVVVAVSCLTLLFLAMQMVKQTWSAVYSTLEISHAWAYVGVAFSAAMMALFAIEQAIVLLLKGQGTPE